MLANRQYDLNNELEGQNDLDMIEEFGDYGGYIGDAISEIADRNISIYNSDILEKAKDLYFSGAYEEASMSGLLEGTHDLIRVLSMSWYQYNTTVLYENMDTMIYNHAIDYINDELNLDEELEVELENRLDGELESRIDNNSMIEDIRDLVDELIEEIRNELEEEEED